MKRDKLVLQMPDIDINELKQDVDGYYLFPLPLRCFIQTESGKPTKPNGDYIEISIDKKGNIEIL